MNGWLIGIGVLYALSLLVEANMHGKQRTGKHSFWLSLISTGISGVLIVMAVMGGW